eukprot:CAMPEP_0182477660 /NCGR_PEP_ID=MMETSP1319-20130603/31220_1 /TAXON_ID=172717 /ORGANISM="Bolidomonas pacifica, Strain RCC208" /LENGTH=487 /DNA_ID=CAMNT_0024678917 /DNA_START=45 /DNA_END=1504 /DNA_ORIENTATION=+
MAEDEYDLRKRDSFGNPIIGSDKVAVEMGRMGVTPGDTLMLEKMTSMSTLGVEENMWDLMYYRLEDKKKAARQEPLDTNAKNQSTSQLDLDDDEIINLPEGLTLKDVALTKAIVDEVGVVNILDSGGKVWVASGAKLRQLVAKKRLRWKMFGDAFSLYLLPSALLIAFGHKMFDRGWANCVQSQTVEYIRQEGSNFTITELEGFARPYCKSLASHCFGIVALVIIMCVLNILSTIVKWLRHQYDLLDLVSRAISPLTPVENHNVTYSCYAFGKVSSSILRIVLMWQFCYLYAGNYVELFSGLVACFFVADLVDGHYERELLSSAQPILKNIEEFNANFAAMAPPGTAPSKIPLRLDCGICNLECVFNDMEEVVGYYFKIWPNCWTNKTTRFFNNPWLPFGGRLALGTSAGLDRKFSLKNKVGISWVVVEADEASKNKGFEGGSLHQYCSGELVQLFFMRVGFHVVLAALAVVCLHFLPYLLPLEASS